jgi:two-component system, chemotaxis family, CheB/CheR fusion protein
MAEQQNNISEKSQRAQSDVPPAELQLGFPVIGIGASAGGLSACKKFFDSLPSDSGAALVVVPHLDPNHKSLMVEILCKHTSMPVIEATDGLVVEPNHVYVIPPNRFLAIHGRNLRLSRLLDHPDSNVVDFFLESLANALSERSVGIVLSGTGNYGTIGLKYVKQAGGMVMAQLPDSAEFPQMPRNAIATGMVDMVLPPELMGPALVSYLQHPYIRLDSEQPSTTPSDEQRIEILSLLKSRRKYDFSNYRKSMVARRIVRRMGLRHLTACGEYLEFIRKNPEEIDSLFDDLLIGVTDFFRDPESFETLKKDAMAEIVRKLPESIGPHASLPEESARHTIRVWIPACSTGEEAYCIGMLLLEQIEAQKKAGDVQIFATDLQERSLEIARRGIYQTSSVANISKERLDRFFVEKDTNHWQVNKELREAVTFAQQNVISDPPFSKMHLICCRNLLIYLDPELQAKIIRLFHFSLAEGGYLMLGPSESIGRDSHLFETVSKKWRIFRRVSFPNIPLDIPIIGKESRTSLPFLQPLPATSSKIQLDKLLQRLVIENFAPAAVVINPQFEILSVLGPLVNYLEFPAGSITHDLLAMARTGLRIKTRSSVRHAIETKQIVRDVDARVKRGHEYFPCSITVQPIIDSSKGANLLLVTFQDLPQPSIPIAERPEATHESTIIEQFENELRALHEDLENTIEEYEHSTTELKASNEEVMTMNEELQSANEELETSREEMQLLNEELTTVNNQLQEKIDELDRSNCDLLNLMSCSNIASIFLDLQLCVKRYTPLLTEIIHLLPSDVNRPFRDLTNKIASDTLLKDCQDVLFTGRSIEREVWTQSSKFPSANQDSSSRRVLGVPDSSHSEPRCYLQRVTPYRSAELAISGVAITFVDITERIASEARSRRLSTVLKDSQNAILVHDFDGQIIAWNRGAEKMYGYSESEALQMNLQRLVPDTKRDETNSYLQRLRHDEGIEPFKTQRVTHDGRFLDVEITVTIYRNELGDPVGAATTEMNVSEREKLIAALNAINESLEKRVSKKTREIWLLAAAVSHLGEGVIITNNSLDGPGPIVSFANAALSKICGYSIEEMIGKSPSIFQGPHSQSHTLDHVKSELKAGRPCMVELVNYRKDGSAYDAELFLSPIFDENGACTNYVSVVRDVSQRNADARELKSREERLRAILDAAVDAIITIDSQCRITSVNTATSKMFGYSPEELIGQNISLLMPNPYRSEHDGYVAKYLKTGQSHIIGIGRELKGLRKNGEVFAIHLSVSEIDHCHSFTGIIRDISATRNMQKQILEIASDQQQDIGQKLREGIGQEITGLALLAETLETEISDAVSSSTNSGAPSQAQEISKRLRDGLFDTQRNLHQLTEAIMPVQVDSEGLRAALQQLVRGTAAQPNVECEFICPNPVVVNSNIAATHLYRIANEAIHNAIHVRPGNKIAVSLTKQDTQIVLTIEDFHESSEKSRLPHKEDTPPVDVQDAEPKVDIMQYRASLIGGRLTWERNANGGVVVQCAIRTEHV